MRPTSSRNGHTSGGERDVGIKSLTIRQLEHGDERGFQPSRRKIQERSQTDEKTPYAGLA